MDTTYVDELCERYELYKEAFKGSGVTPFPLIDKDRIAENMREEEAMQRYRTNFALPQGMPE
jgi:hypothetical protein